MPISAKASPSTLPFPANPATPADWRQLVERANTGDSAALAAVRQVLQQQPGLVDAAADLEQTCRDRALDLVCGHDLVLRETLLLKVQALEAEFAGSSPSPAQRSASRRAALAWLVLQAADLHCTEQLQCGTVPKRWLDYRDVSERRYAASLQLVETVRGLAARQKPC